MDAHSVGRWVMRHFCWQSGGSRYSFVGAFKVMGRSTPVTECSGSQRFDKRSSTSAGRWRLEMSKRSAKNVVDRELVFLVESVVFFGA